MRAANFSRTRQNPIYVLPRQVVRAGSFNKVVDGLDIRLSTTAGSVDSLHCWQHKIDIVASATTKVTGLGSTTPNHRNYMATTRQRHMIYWVSLIDTYLVSSPQDWGNIISHTHVAFKMRYQTVYIWLSIVRDNTNVILEPVVKAIRWASVDAACVVLSDL